jgi:hypothetical protein
MNPSKVDEALRSIYTVWLSVMAVLCIQFARTIQMANSISEFMAQPVKRYVLLQNKKSTSKTKMGIGIVICSMFIASIKLIPIVLFVFPISRLFVLVSLPPTLNVHGVMKCHTRFQIHFTGCSSRDTRQI